MVRISLLNYAKNTRHTWASLLLCFTHPAQQKSLRITNKSLTSRVKNIINKLDQICVWRVGWDYCYRNKNSKIILFCFFFCHVCTYTGIKVVKGTTNTRIFLVSWLFSTKAFPINCTFYIAKPFITELSIMERWVFVDIFCLLQHDAKNRALYGIFVF